MGIARLWSTFCLRFLVCAGFRCTFALIRASNRGSSTQQSPGYLMLPTEGDAKLARVLLYGRGRVGDRHLKNAPVGVALVETTDQKHHGLSFSRRVCGTPLASKEIAQPASKFLD